MMSTNGLRPCLPLPPRACWWPLLHVCPEALFCPVSVVKLLPVVLTAVVLTAVLLLLVLFVSTVCINCTVFGTLQVFVPLSVKICMGLLQGQSLIFPSDVP